MDTLKKLGYIFGKKQKLETAGLAVMIIIGTVLELLGVSTIQPLINAFVEPENLMRKDFFANLYSGMGLQNMTQLILVLIGALILLYIVKNVYLVFMYRCQYKYIYSNMRILSTKMMRSYLSRSYSYHTSKSTAELLRNINQDTADFFGVIQAVIQLVTEGLVVAALAVYLFIKDKSITIAVGCMLAIFLVIFYRIYKRSLLKMGQKNRYYEAQVTKWVQQSFGGIKEVKVMNKEDFFYDKYDEAFQGRVHSEYTYHTMISIPKPLIEAVCMVALLGATAIKLMRGISAGYLVPTLSMFVIAAYRLLPSFNRITEYLGTIAYQKPAVSAIYDDLREIDAYVPEKKAEDESAVKPLPFENDIKIDNISFHYPDSENLVLDKISFAIEKNTSVAFIGQSGAGKTTLADIILGVLTPTSGHVIADDIVVEDHLNEWHRTIGYIPQNIYLMDDTIAANIAFGVPESEIDKMKLERAVDRAQLRDVIDKLPEGLNTKVGERGVRFSGGQRQRIGIARALYNEPQILVLDEATSALDNETEKAVMSAIDALHGEMTLIIIAHRLSTISNCDYVYKIGNGKAELQKDKV